MDPHDDESPLVESKLFAKIVETDTDKAPAESIRSAYLREEPQVEVVEVLVSAPLRYLDACWWAFGTRDDGEVQTFDLVRLATSLVPHGRGLKARLVIHPFRVWHGHGHALAIDLPEEQDVRLLQDALNRESQVEWTCTMEVGEAQVRPPHLRHRRRHPTEGQLDAKREPMSGISVSVLEAELRDRVKLDLRAGVGAGPLVVLSAGNWGALLRWALQRLDVPVDDALPGVTPAAVVVLEDSVLADGPELTWLQAQPKELPIALFAASPAEPAFAAGLRAEGTLRGAERFLQQALWLASWFYGLDEDSPRYPASAEIAERAVQASEQLRDHLGQYWTRCDDESARVHLESARSDGLLPAVIAGMLEAAGADIGASAKEPDDLPDGLAELLVLWREAMQGDAQPAKPQVVLVGSKIATEQLRTDLESDYTVLDRVPTSSSIRPWVLLVVSDKNDAAVDEGALASALEGARADRATVIAGVVAAPEAPLGSKVLTELDTDGELLRVPHLAELSDQLQEVLRNYNRGDLVFISYCRSDDEKEGFIREFCNHLKLLERKNVLQVWVDRGVRAGSEWQTKLLAARAAAGVACIFASSGYHASDLIRRLEYDPILKAHRRGDLETVWAAVENHLWDDTELGRLQTPLDPRKWVLSKLDGGQRSEALVKLAQETRLLVERAKARRSVGA
jgi:hypothetical protein